MRRDAASPVERLSPTVDESSVLESKLQSMEARLHAVVAENVRKILLLFSWVGSVVSYLCSNRNMRIARFPVITTAAEYKHKLGNQVLWVLRGASEFIFFFFGEPRARCS